MNIYLDIETIPTQQAHIGAHLLGKIKAPANYKDEAKIAAYLAEKRQGVVENTALNGTWGEIISIACAIDENEPVVFYENDWQFPDREYLILSNFFHYLEKHYQANQDLPPVFIGHNHIDFDLPFIYCRAIINRIPLPKWFPIHVKAWSDKVFDTMQEWAGYGNKISMNDLCFALGIQGKTGDIDGSKVWEYVQQGKVAEVAEYNKADVERTRIIYKRMHFAL